MYGFVAKNGFQCDGGITILVGCGFDKWQIFNLLYFARHVVIFLQIDIQPIRTAFDVPDLDVFGLQVVERGGQLG